jgi:hypothetical protein
MAYGRILLRLSHQSFFSWRFIKVLRSPAMKPLKLGQTALQAYFTMEPLFNNTAQNYFFKNILWGMMNS